MTYRLMAGYKSDEGPSILESPKVSDVQDPGRTCSDSGRDELKFQPKRFQGSSGRDSSDTVQ